MRSLRPLLACFLGPLGALLAQDTQPSTTGLAHDAWRVRNETARALGKAPQIDVASVLRYASGETPGEEVCERHFDTAVLAVHVLGVRAPRDASAVAALEELLASDDEEVARTAATALAWAGAPARSALRRALADPN